MTAKHQHIANHEITASQDLPYSSLVTDSVVRNRDGTYVCTWRIDGIPFETTDAVDLSIKKEALNQLIRGLGEVALWSHRIRRQYQDQFQQPYPEAFSDSLAKRYYASFDGYNMMQNETYLTLCYRPYGRVKSGLFGRVISLTEKSERALKDAENHALRKMAELIAQIQVSLKAYAIERLSTYQENNIQYSQQLSFYGYLLNGVWEKVPVTHHCIREILQTSRLFFVGEKLEIRAPNQKRFAALLDLKDYPENTDSGCLNGLLYTPYEYIETQSFSILDKPTAKDKLERQRNQLITTEDAGVSQINALNVALDQLTNGDFVYGEYHYTLAVLGSSLDETSRNMAHARSVLSDEGYQTA
ncbi:MAG TPA: hypothetical protein PKV03_12650, partial [Methylotenera sp.]|nr:hypothetical protein [Methylotenera sp.]